MNAIWQTLIYTPWWVYFIFIYLLKVGFKASRTNIISLKKLFILPAVFLVMSLHTLITSVQLTFINFIFYFLALICGIGGGWMLVKNMDLQFDKVRGLIRLPGSWGTLLLVLTIFTVKYFFGYSLAVDPSRAEDTLFELSMLCVSGVCTGMLVGRLFCYLVRQKNATHQDL